MTLDAWCSTVGYSQADIADLLVKYQGMSQDQILSLLVDKYVQMYMNDAEVCFILICAGQNTEQNARGFLAFTIRMRPMSVLSREALIKVLYTRNYKLYSKLFPKILECALIFDGTLFDNLHRVYNGLRSNKTLDKDLSESARLVIYESILDEILANGCFTSK